MIPVISKLFELVIIEICEQFLSCDELQFGFKKGVGCSEEYFALHSTIDYFKNRGSSIFVAALDISKAFDTVNHYKLYFSLINSGIPKWVLNVIINWYMKVSALVRWKTALSNIVYAILTQFCKVKQYIYIYIYITYLYILYIYIYI